MMIRDNHSFLMARGAGSRIEIHASDAIKQSWTQLAETAEAGSQSITLGQASGWEIGDRIAIASTGFEMDEAEERTITGISSDGRTLTLDRALEQSHYGEIESHDNGRSGPDAQTRSIDMRAEVALLSRNVTIQGDAGSADDGYGGHTMIMDGAAMHLDGVEITRMGQAGELGRYPLHWHMLGDAAGQYVTNSSIHHTFNKGMTLHGTQNTWVEDNVIFDTIGHSYYFEDGSEFGNVLVGNLGMNTRATESVAAGSIGSDHTAASTYWVTNPDNHMIDNHAAGSDHVGFWILSQTGVQGTSATVGIYDDYRPNAQTPGTWIGNTSHTNGEDGLFIGGEFVEETGERTGFDPHLQQVFAMDAFTTFKNQGFGLWVRNGGGEWEDLLIADSKKGVRMWGANEIDGGLIVGRSGNYEDFGFDSYHGWELYDMASRMNDVHFAGFSGQNDAAIANHSGFGRNTNNAVQNLTFGDDVDRPFATRTHTSFLEGLVDAGGGLMGGLHDLDGSLTGQPGAIITPGIIDSRPGIEADILAYAFDDIPASGFNASAGATWDAAGRFWLNPAGSVVGKQTFATSTDEAERVDFTITRTDTGAAILYDAATQGRNGWAQLNVDGAMTGEYVVAHPDGTPLTPLEVQIRDLPLGTAVIYRFADMPQGTVVQGAEAVANRAGLDAADGTAWFRDGNGDLVLKMVADRFQERPYEAIFDLPGVGDDVYQDFVRFIFDPAPGDANTGDLRAQPKPEVGRPDAAPTPIPDRADSTSDTIADTDGLARWSDATTWDGVIPDADDVVVIGAGQQVLLDTDVDVEGIIVAGEGAALVVEDTQGGVIDLAADWVLVEAGGLFQAGNEDDLLDTDFTLTLTGDDPGHDLDVAAHVAGEMPDTVFVSDTAELLEKVIGEAGSVRVSQRDADQWHDVLFDEAIPDAVVVMGPVSSNGSQPAMTRIRDVTDTGFSFQIDEWDYADGAHKLESIGWLAVSSGTHTLATGQTLVAAQSDVDTRFQSQDFGTALSDAIVLTEVASANDVDAVTTRTRAVNADGFELRLREEEAADGRHLPETVNWIAIETGTGPELEAGVTGDTVTDAVQTIDFSVDFDGSPILIADMQTTDGGNTAILRYDALSDDAVGVRVQEEQSLDAETSHTTEVVGWLALDEGLLYGM